MEKVLKMTFCGDDNSSSTTRESQNGKIDPCWFDLSLRTRSCMRNVYRGE